MLPLTFVSLTVFVDWTPLDRVNEQFYVNKFPDFSVCTQVSSLAKVVVDIAVVFGTYLNPDSFTFLHRLEGLSDMLMLLQICHIKLFFDSSLLFKVDQLSIVKSSFVRIVNYISFITFSIELGGC
jgi:hypothetical protein